MAYERFGDPAAPPVLLIMGGGAQMINWPEGFCTELVDRGMRVIRFDNRDTGRSSHLSDAPAPDPRAAMSGDLSSASYTLSDMAADGVGLLGVLGVDSVHRSLPRRDDRADDRDRVSRPSPVADVDDVDDVHHR